MKNNSERASRREMDGIVTYLEKELMLPVNREKSRVDMVKNVPFMGFQILRGKIRVSDKARIKFKNRVRELIRRNNPLSMYQIIQELNEYLQGMDTRSDIIGSLSSLVRHAFDTLEIPSKILPRSKRSNENQLYPLSRSKSISVDAFSNILSLFR